MKKEILTHIVFFVSFFLLISLFRRWFGIEYIVFWLGGIVGTFLPDTDHLIYVYFLRPQELTSQRTARMAGNKNYWGMIKLLFDTREERRKLIFHSAFFQVIFVILSFLVITSSGSLFGRGLVLAFFLHLLVDQFVDLTATQDSPDIQSQENIMNPNPLKVWFKGLGISPNKERVLFYWLALVLLFIIFGFFL